MDIVIHLTRNALLIIISNNDFSVFLRFYINQNNILYFITIYNYRQSPVICVLKD